ASRAGSAPGSSRSAAGRRSSRSTAATAAWRSARGWGSRSRASASASTANCSARRRRPRGWKRPSRSAWSARSSSTASARGPRPCPAARVPSRSSARWTASAARWRPPPDPDRPSERRTDLRVNIADLRQQYEGIGKEIEAEVLKVLRSGVYILGENVRALEAEFAQACGVGHAVALNSGTDALWLSLWALGVGPGDEVILPSFTIICAAAVVCLLKAKPVLVDIDPATFALDPADVERKITDRTKAIIAVHLFGQTADMGPLLDVARRRNLPVVEDACQSHGAAYARRKAGALGTTGCFSFYPANNLGTFGAGRVLTTTAKDLRD